MLLIVQLVQIARAQTTFENMHRNLHRGSIGATGVVTSTLVSGTTTLEAAQLTSSGMGPDPALSRTHAHQSAYDGSFLWQWKRLLGLDTFLVTAKSGLGGNRVHQSGNPFSRGLIVNCRDFWCDGVPIFGARETGSASLGREAVDYTKMYETPPRMSHVGMLSRQEAGVYHSVAEVDSV